MCTRRIRFFLMKNYQYASKGCSFQANTGIALLNAIDTCKVDYIANSIAMIVFMTSCFGYKETGLHKTACVKTHIHVINHFLASL